MTSYDDFTERESRIWQPFGYAMRFSDAQVVERAIIFGLFSGAYQNGMDYLQAINDFELALILDTYNQKMAGLDADEQNAIIGFAARRYIENVNHLIHDDQLIAKQDEIDAQDAEWDAKFEALSTDRAALETLAAQYEGRQREIAARIQNIQTDILLEGMNLEMAETAILEKALDVSKAENALSGKDVEIARKDVEIAGKAVNLSQKDVELAQKDVELSEKSNAILKINLAEAEGELKILETGLDVLRIQMQVVETGLKKLDLQKDAAQMGIQTVEYADRISKTSLIEIDLRNAAIENTLATVELGEKGIQGFEIENDIAKIGLQKQQIDLDYIDVDKEVAQIKMQTAGLISKISETALLEVSYTEAIIDSELAYFELNEKTLQKLEIDNDIAKIGLQSQQIELDYLAVDEELSQIKSKTAELISKISNTAMLNTDLAEANVGLAEANVGLAGKGTQLIEVENEILKTELQKLQIDMDRLDVLQSLNNIYNEGARLTEGIAEVGIVEAQVFQEQAELDAEIERLAMYASKVSIIKSRTSGITINITNKTQELANTTTLHNAEVSMTVAKQDYEINKMGNENEDAITDLDWNQELVEAEKEMVEETEAPLGVFTDLNIATIEAQTQDNYYRGKSAVTELEKLMSAELLTTLKHSIGTA